MADDLTGQIAAAITQLAALADNAAEWHRLAYDRSGIDYEHRFAIARPKTSRRSHSDPPKGLHLNPISAAADIPAARRWTRALTHLQLTHHTLNITDNAPVGTHPRVLAHLCQQIAAHIHRTPAEHINPKALDHIRQAAELLPDQTPTTPCADPRNQHPNRRHQPANHGLCHPCLTHERHILNQPVWRTQWGCRTWLCPNTHHAHNLCATHLRRAQRHKLLPSTEHAD